MPVKSLNFEMCFKCGYNGYARIEINTFLFNTIPNKVINNYY